MRILLLHGEQGWRSGESARLTSMWPGFDSRTRRHMCVEFVVGPLLCSVTFFSGHFCFPLSSKTNISKFQFDPGMDEHFKRVLLIIPGAPWINKLHLQFYIYMYVRLHVCAPSKRDFLKVRFCSIKARLGASLPPKTISKFTPLSLFTSLKGMSLNFFNGN